MKTVRFVVIGAVLVVALMLAVALTLDASAQVVPEPGYNGLAHHLVALNAMFSSYDVAPPYGVIGKEETTLLQNYFMSYYVSWFDFNKDGVIDIQDIAAVASRDGCTVVDQCYW